ncbi:MAG TPA: hypothetical protein PLY68_02055 [Myxococcota bacterium]|nr:hypothetical protein [Myxococcota bacterium]HNZ02534.1 hypothetical protein [Myxococcota bacterium]HOD06498.1 hypothetical protein [Myxococcota bacterium]HPB49900.1 hypothetical protein [Myxococcota bacterium]HQP94961.1 hypothetical protein [Myxococcota bacterium]
MSLFGNKEIQELRSELERAGARVKKAEADLASAMKKAAAAEQAGNDATESAAALERQVQELRRDVARLNESKTNAEKAAAFYEQRCAGVATEIEAARRDVEAARLLESSAKALEAHLKSENSRLKADNERLSALLQQREAERPAKAVATTVAPADDAQAGDIRLLRAELEDCRRRLAENDEMRRVAVRKAEHNRRAWLITQMQLDLAEDRLCLVTTGKPRPVLEDSMSPCDPDVETLEAEEVEGGDDVGPAASVDRPGS